eukprot:349091_1
MKILKTVFRRQLHSPVLCSEKPYYYIYSLPRISFRSFSQKKSKKRARWKIFQLSTHIMRKEANIRGESIREMLLKGYKLFHEIICFSDFAHKKTLLNDSIRIEIYEKSIQDIETPPGDAYKLKDFIMGYFSDIATIENERTRKTHGVNLISQMAFDVRLIPTTAIDDSYNTQTLRKLQEWTERQSDIITLEPIDKKLIQTDTEKHQQEDKDSNVIDYIEEEEDNTVGYFKDWDKDNQ